MFDPASASPSSSILDAPPFVHVSGVINIRQLGGYATKQPGTITKTNAIFRSGELTHITQEGKEELRALGVKRVFDMRAPAEVKQLEGATPEVDGVVFEAVPTSLKGFDPVSLAERLQGFKTTETETFMKIYEEILTVGAPSYERIFRHIIDKPEEPCLVHCTAGKDRTGVFSMLILLVLGVSEEDIIKDYALTTDGLAPVLHMLIARFSKIPAYSSNMEGTMNMGSSRPTTMRALLDMLKEKYGGVEAYLKTWVHLDDADFVQLRRNLIVPI
ncbi:hypothetical protein CYLTODRAFT_432849 [Cylindrobasidium torrendii FP15055 ss-10]|uniref:Tyrosine specific protein phosphatases domain-containing protein n=1 Tax=Cylindrobasidium torrendii FP15055 ss-10 TaxID=1314674 RepID=A0A0D7B2G7_9AGAR|nr:hypothetical protein CYLTODRAFT_432849 [Cylindrobasidium torrendii FP15055 ss-10]